MAEDIDWSKILVASAGEPSTCSYAFDCVICMRSVPINNIRQPVVPICQDCREVLRELVEAKRADKEKQKEP